MSTTRFTNSTAIAYLLLGEGPMRLKNGLNSIYLNRTPLSNSAVASANLARDAIVYANGTGTALMLGLARLGVEGTFPLLIKGAGKLGTGTIVAGSSTLNTTGSFFTADMLASDSAGDGGLYQKVRIPGAGPNGSELAAEVVQIISTTQAILSSPAFESVSGVPITWDHFTYATERNIFSVNEITLDTTIPRSDLFNNPTADQSTWVPLLATIGNGSQGAGFDTTSKMNFKNVKVNFRPGTLDQQPVLNTGGFTNASQGSTFNIPLSQIDAIDNGGIPVAVHNSKTRSYWGGRDFATDIKPTTPATSATTIISGAGTNGLNVANASEVDELAITMSFPSGLSSLKTSNNAYGLAGCVFQIYFDYKVASAGVYQSKLMFGPSASEVATRTQGYFVHDTGDLAVRWFTSGTVKSNNTSNFSQEFRFSVDEFKPFDDFRIRIIKLTPDSFKANGWVHTCDSILTSVQAFINDKLSYPLSSYLAIEFNSQEFQGQFPDIAVHAYGIECDVPKNYVTRQEAADGIAKYTRNGSGTITTTYVPWNGTFRRVYTDNPVWIVRELLLNKRYGLGSWITPDQINDYALYSLARYCDDLVPDGEGGFEPRFTCSAYLTTSTEAYKVIKDFFTTMLAIPYWVDGKLMAVGDRPGMPVYTFSKANIEGGIFSYEGTGNKVRANQVAVTYNDKDFFYEPRIEIVDDIDDIISTNRVITDEVVAFGATSRGQATRYGRWKMLTGKMQKDIISFRTAENAMFLKPGDIISVQDADKNRVRYSGRVNVSTTTVVQLDKGIDIASGEVYEIHVLVPGPATYLAQQSAVISGTTYKFGNQIPVFTEDAARDLVDDDGNEVVTQFSSDMHLETRVVINSVGDNQSAIEVNSAFSSAPIADFMWAITATTSSGQVIVGSAKDYRILNISEEQGGLYGIIATEHYNSKFDLVNEDYLLEPLTEAPRYSDIPAPRDFTAGLQITLGGTDTGNSSIVPKILLSWRVPVKIVQGIEQVVDNLDSYLLRYVNPEGIREEISLSSSSTSYVINNPSLGSYSFTLQSKSNAGPVSRPVFADIIVQLDTITPGLAAQLKLLKGGEFTRPPIIEDGGVEMPQDYDYTSPIGTTVKVRSGII